jgi:hypothetical protein
MMTLEFHPLANIFPLLEGEAFEELVADIKANGLREKIDLYQGKIVDGRYRYRALQRLGIDPSADPSRYFRKALYVHSVGGEARPHEQSNDDRVRAYIISKNIHRRHLTAEQRRELIAKLVKAQPEKSNRQIAKQVKVDHKTVAAVRKEQVSRGEIPHVEARTDSKGRKQPAKKEGERADWERRERAESCQLPDWVKQQNAFIRRAERAIEYASYDGPVSPHVIDWVEHVAKRWTELAAELRKRSLHAGNGTDPEASAEARKAQFAELDEDGLDIPQSLRR